VPARLPLCGRRVAWTKTAGGTTGRQRAVSRATRDVEASASIDENLINRTSLTHRVLRESLRGSATVGMIRSDYREVPGPHKGNWRRELFRVFEGRFCFPIGVGIHCGGATSFEITKGQTRSLELGFSAAGPVPGSPGLNIGKSVEYTHTFGQQIGPWEVGKCDSMYPVLCFNNAVVRIYRSRRPIRRYELSAFAEVFDPCGNQGWVDKNLISNDPECDECHDQSAPTNIDVTSTRARERFPQIILIRPAALLPVSPSDGYRDDAQAAAREIVEAIAQLIGSDEQETGAPSLAAITRSDGAAIWLTGSPTAGQPNLAQLPSGLSSLPREITTFDQSLVPVVAVGAAPAAARCVLTILVQAPGENELRTFVREEAAVFSPEGITAVWYEADFAELPGFRDHRTGAIRRRQRARRIPRPGVVCHRSALASSRKRERLVLSRKGCAARDCVGEP
jgi:hypothetical protein